MLRNPYLRHLAGVFRKKLASCNYPALLAGLPALAAAGAAVVYTILALQPGPQELMSKYAGQGKIAFEANDYGTARICFERFVTLDPAKQESLYYLAKVLGRTGQSEQGKAILRHLAPVDQAGFGPAHILLAQTYLAEPQLQLWGEARSHLLHALDLGHDLDTVHAVLGEFYRRIGDGKEAAKQWEMVKWRRPALHFLLLRLYNLLNEPDKAREEARQAAAYFEGQLKTNAKDIDARVSEAEALLYLAEHSKTVGLLEDGLRLADNAADYRRLGLAMARVHAAWLRELDRKDNTVSAQKIALLQKGLEFDPYNSDLLDWLFISTRAPGEHADRARVILQRILAEGDGSPTAHFILGLQAFDRDDTDAAKVHLEQAYRLAPNMPYVANNLAYALARGKPPAFTGGQSVPVLTAGALASLAEPNLAVGMTQLFLINRYASSLPDLHRAFALINRVIQDFPNEPHFRDTRGFIFMRLGNWKDAVTDLEFALKADPKNRNLHELLAEAYKHSGDPAMAAEHQRLAREKAP